MWCKYWEKCPGYRKYAWTCHHEKEAEGYCGIYKHNKNVNLANFRWGQMVN